MNGKLVMAPEAHRPQGPAFWTAVHAAEGHAKQFVISGRTDWAEVWASRKDGLDVVHCVHPGNFAKYQEVVRGRPTRMLSGWIRDAGTGQVTEVPVSHDNAQWCVR
jgi:hypothetical protein